MQNCVGELYLTYNTKRVAIEILRRFRVFSLRCLSIPAFYYPLFEFISPMWSLAGISRIMRLCTCTCSCPVLCPFSVLFSAGHPLALLRTKTIQTWFEVHVVHLKLISTAEWNINFWELDRRACVLAHACMRADMDKQITKHKNVCICVRAHTCMRACSRAKIKIEIKIDRHEHERDCICPCACACACVRLWINDGWLKSTVTHYCVHVYVSVLRDPP